VLHLRLKVCGVAALVRSGGAGFDVESAEVCCGPDDSGDLFTLFFVRLARRNARR